MVKPPTTFVQHTPQKLLLLLPSQFGSLCGVRRWTQVQTRKETKLDVTKTRHLSRLAKIKQTQGKGKS